MQETKFDLIVVGGGPGGYVAAIRGAQLGLKTALIEETHLGGICLNWGCIPTKTLLRSGEIYALMQHAEDFGLRIEGASFDMTKIVARSRSMATQLAKGVQHLLKKNKVTVFADRGKLTGKSGNDFKLQAGSNTLTSPHVILATGARAKHLPNPAIQSSDLWSYREAMVPEACPESILVIGSGAIGIEFASFYRALNAKVTVIEILDRILPVEDEEISTLARKSFEKRGIMIKTSTSLQSLTPASSGHGFSATLKTPQGEEKIEIEKVIVAIGIVGNTENLGLETTRAKVDRDHIVVNEWAETAEPGLYAIGDVAGAPWLAHKASHEGIIAVERIAGLKNLHPLKRENIPGCTYSSPQIASIGLTEKKAREVHKDIKVGRFPFMANGKAIAMGETEGMIKTIFDTKTGELLGAHMIGAEVTELIQGYAIGKAVEATETEFIHTIFPHPTLSEIMHESCLDAIGQGIHL